MVARTPLLEYDARCPVLVVADTRRPTNQGLGARATFLLWAADVALRLHAVLAIDDRFWSKGYVRGYHYGNSFVWAWGLFPFPNASSALRRDMLPAGMAVTRGTYTVDNLLRSWECNRVYRLQAGQVNSCGESVRWCYDRLPGALDRGFAAVTSAPTPRLKAWRAVARNHTRNHSALTAVALPRALAVWHVRTGDITLPLRQQAAAQLKRTIDSGFPNRGVRHVLVTFQAKTLAVSMPWFASALGITEVLDNAALDDVSAFRFMLGADVLVSTGSSFPHIPAALASPGRQLHFFLPPKGMVELRDGGSLCCIPSTCHCELPAHQLTRPQQQPGAADIWTQQQKAPTGAAAAADAQNASSCAQHHHRQGHRNVSSLAEAESSFIYRTRTHPQWMGSWVRRNAVPVACSGEVFPEYKYKLRELARAIDGGGRADAAIAELSYEGWLR